jgi:hypothetical protein
MQFETVLLNKNLIPKDILKFNVDPDPFLYSDFFLKLSPYGKFANMKEFLHFHRNNPKVYLSDLKRNIISYVKLWVKSKALYDYQAPLRTFFSSLIKAV